MHKFDAKLDEIAILASEDTHYSIPKASNLLQIDWLKIPVGFENREIDAVALDNIILEAKNKGKKYFIAVSNMATTMFGSVDNPDVYTSALEKHNAMYRLHIDGAYGGFVYPFSNQKSNINFSNPKLVRLPLMHTKCCKLLMEQEFCLPKRFNRKRINQRSRIRRRNGFNPLRKSLWRKCSCGLDDFIHVRSLWLV